MRAGYCRPREHAGTQTLARHLEQTELADLADLDAGAIVADGVVQSLLDRTVILVVFHVDEIDHDQTRKIAKPKLTGDLIRRFEIGLGGGFLDRVLARRLAGIDVDGD